ncbi:MAG: zinc-binding dehydrogenase [Cetobacterium sp.]
MKTAVIGIGGLGHIAVKFLNKLGYDVTAFTSTPAKTEMIKGLGANHVIVSSDPKQMTEAANKFDFIINTLPIKDGFAEYLHSTAPGGYFVQVGVPAYQDSTLSFPTVEIVSKELTLVGSIVGPRHTINKMVALCAEKDIYPMVEEFSFEDFPKAFDK